MPQASRPPLRASAALALAIYAVVLIAGSAAFHAFLCSGHPAPHCVVCDSVQAVASLVDPPVALGRDASDAGTVHGFGQPCDRHAIAPATVNRAPPASAS
jgi:hypothetical protein